MSRLVKIGIILFAILFPILANAMSQNQRVAILNPAPPSLYFIFTGASSLPSIFTFQRTSGATSALYTDAPGAAFTTYTANQPRFFPGRGIVIEQGQTNFLLNSNTPATQTVTLAAGTYYLFGNGTGTIVSAAGTAIGTGFGTISTLQSNYQTISISVGGTVVITITGTVDWFDLQANAGSFEAGIPTSHIVTTGTSASRAAEYLAVPVSLLGTTKSDSVGISFYIGPGWNQNNGTGRLVGVSTSGAAIPQVTPAGLITVYVVSGGSPTTANSITTFSFNTAVARWSPSVNSAILNSGAIAKAAGGSSVTNSPITFGSDSSFYVGQVFFQMVSIYPQYISDAQARSIATGGL